MKNFDFIVGIDEVGRGPVAGPVAVGALMVESNYLEKVSQLFEGFKDSKKLTPKKRNEWFKNIQQAKNDGLLDYKIVYVDNKEIDEKGIAPSIKVCIRESLLKLKLDSKKTKVLLDGGLKAPEEFSHQETIIKGDENEMLIALASIVAKVSRDALMCKFAKDYPDYGFEKHKGYGTKGHMEVIKEKGICEIHRKSYLKKFV